MGILRGLCRRRITATQGYSHS